MLFMPDPPTRGSLPRDVRDIPSGRKPPTRSGTSVGFRAAYTKRQARTKSVRPANGSDVPIAMRSVIEYVTSMTSCTRGMNERRAAANRASRGSLSACEQPFDCKSFCEIKMRQTCVLMQLTKRRVKEHKKKQADWNLTEKYNVYNKRHDCKRAKKNRSEREGE